MITVFSLYGITATANFCWHRKHLKITKSLKYSFNFRCYGFYVTTFKSFIFLLDTSDTYTFNVASIGNECWSKFLTCLPKALQNKVFVLKKKLEKKLIFLITAWNCFAGLNKNLWSQKSENLILVKTKIK